MGTGKILPIVSRPVGYLELYLAITNSGHLSPGNRQHIPHCQPACRIPRAVLSHHKHLVKSLSTWEQLRYPHCQSACRIPRAVLSHHKHLVKSLSTWEQLRYPHCQSACRIPRAVLSHHKQWSLITWEQATYSPLSASL